MHRLRWSAIISAFVRIISPLRYTPGGLGGGAEAVDVAPASTALAADWKLSSASDHDNKAIVGGPKAAIFGDGSDCGRDM